MQSLKKIMEEMGFNKDAPLETQKAFIKHLIAAANHQAPPPTTVPAKVQAKENKKASTQVEQLSFDLSDNKRVS
jgi:hypothetical protein